MGFCRDWGAAQLLRRKATLSRNDDLIRRKIDGSLWVAGSPKDFSYAMRGLFKKEQAIGEGFHFYRVRMWQGVLVASRKVFWLARSGEFELLEKAGFYRTHGFDEQTECRLIDAKIAKDQ